jgi:succinate dehydrogenase / fumarate reductase flavoprotein subunit
MGTTMNEHAAVFRTTEGLKLAQDKITLLKDRYKSVPVQDKGSIFNTNLISTLELGFMLDCAETIIVGAMERKESRGAHTMLDYPNRDDENWLKHIRITSTDNGPKVDYIPVKITQWQPEIRSY